MGRSAVGPSPAPLELNLPEATSKGRFSPIVRAWRSKAPELPGPSCRRQAPTGPAPRGQGLQTCTPGNWIGVQEKPVLLELPC